MVIKKYTPDSCRLKVKCYSSPGSRTEYELTPVPNIFGSTTIAVGYENLRHYFQNAESMIKVEFPAVNGLNKEQRKELTRIIAERNIELDKKFAEELKKKISERPY